MPVENISINKAEPEVHEYGKARKIVEFIRTIALGLIILPLGAMSIHQGPNVEGKGKGGRIVNPPEEATEAEEQAKEQATAIRPTITEEPKENVNYWLE